MHYTYMKKMKRTKLLNLTRLYIHLKIILYRFIYLHTMYMFSCWWNDHQCLDIPKLPLTFSSIRKKRHLFNKCIICSSQILFLISLINVSCICLSFKLTGVSRRFKYAVKTESVTNPRLENMLIHFHIANVFKHLKGLKMDFVTL